MVYIHVSIQMCPKSHLQKHQFRKFAGGSVPRPIQEGSPLRLHTYTSCTAGHATFPNRSPSCCKYYSVFQKSIAAVFPHHLHNDYRPPLLQQYLHHWCTHFVVFIYVYLQILFSLLSPVVATDAFLSRSATVRSMGAGDHRTVYMFCTTLSVLPSVIVSVRPSIYFLCFWGISRMQNS